MARWRVSSRLRENDGKADLSIFFHGALKGMLMAPSRVHDLGHLGFSDFVSEYATHADAMLMDMQHDAGRLFPVFIEETF